jgi:hypothetical protein
MKKESLKKSDETSQDPAPRQLSYTWLTEEEMKKIYCATNGILREWRKKGLVYSKPSGRTLFNQTDVQEFLIRHRKSDKRGDL